jgi:S1-C subfamily serine protease
MNKSKFLVIGILLLAAMLSVIAVGSAAAQNGNNGTGRPLLGVSLNNTDEGVQISNVLPGSPAEEAGLQTGDLITAVNGEAVETARDVQDAVSALNVGETVSLDITRDGEAQTVEATLVSGRTVRGIPEFSFTGGDVAIRYNPEDQTWEIVSLSEDSALYELGLREGDVITAVNGESVDPLTLRESLADLEDNATVTLTITRDGESQDLEVDLESLGALALPFFNFDFPGMRGERFGFGQGGQRGEGRGNMPDFVQPMFGGHGHLGITFTMIDDEVADENGLTVTEGALVEDVLEDSPAAEAGLEVGDVITAVNGEAVNAATTLRERISLYDGGDEVTLSVLRGGETLDISVTLGDFPGMGGMFPFMEGMPGMRGFRFGMPGEGGMFQFEIPAPDAAPEVVPADPGV